MLWSSTPHIGLKIPPQESLDPHLLAQERHVSDPRNDFPKAILSAQKVLHFPILTQSLLTQPPIAQKRPFIMLKKSEHHHNASSHHIDISM